MKNGLLPYLLGATALCLSAVSAYFSIFGLSRLFAGAGVSILIMAGVMEVSKIVLTVYIHRFWDKLHFLFKTYLISAVMALVLITTMGAYGFLSAGFQTSSVKLDMYQAGKTFVEDKINFFQQEVDLYNRDLDRVTESINQLSSTRSTSIQVRDTSAVGGVRNTISTVDVRRAQENLEIERSNRVEIVNNRQASIDSLQRYRQEFLAIQNDNDLIQDIGPLQFLSEVTGYPMVKIVNILIVLIILVLDPLAISMILASSIGIEKKLDIEEQPEKKEEELEPIIEQPVKLPTTPPKEVQESKTTEVKIEKKKGDTWEKYNSILNKLHNPSKPTPEKIIQKSPSYYHVKMSDGSRKKIHKNKLVISEDGNKIRYM